MTVRLEWRGKPSHIDRIHLPFQVVETINESRASRERDPLFLQKSQAPPPSAFRNLLIWGDNKLVMGSLLKDYAGQFKLVYIDPPFDTGADFSYRVSVGDGDIEKLPSILEEHAYRDTWGGGKDSYLTMLFERLVLIHELLSTSGLLFLHIGPGVSHIVRAAIDEIFGADRFRNEIVWKRTSAHSDARTLGSVHETILVYSKGDEWTWNTQYVPYEDWYVEQYYRYKDPDGRRFMSGDLGAAGLSGGGYDYEWKGVRRVWRVPPESMRRLDEEGRIFYTRNGIPRIKRYLDESKGQALSDVWNDIFPVVSWSKERVGYDTQKPEGLIERIVKLGSDPGDLVGDFFVGSGTTAVVAERAGRRWVACDLGRFAIHTTRKRLLGVPGCQPFSLLNLGSYERQRWEQATSNGALRAYIDTILAFYRADPVSGFVQLHGKKAGRMVHVGATDSPVTLDEAEAVMDELADNGIGACDLLGWEWEMGFHDTIGEVARRRGLDLRPRQIPREVIERQVTEADAIRFFELAHVDLEIRRRDRAAAVVLRDFIIPSEDLIPSKVRAQIVSWADLIDYWSVDFDYRDDTFHNQWQTYRTRDEPVLATQTEWHEYAEPGRYAVVIKIIDIFGNDTTKLAEVSLR